MADATRSQLLTRLNIKARDGSNVTFTAEEKNDALESAINDSLVTKVVRDATLTTLSNTDHYTIPSTLDTVHKVGLQISTYGKPDDVDGWGVYDSELYFDNLPDAGYAIVLYGTKKLTKFDAIPDNRQEYVLVLAKLELVQLLKESLANTFLTNDMTMGDLLQLEQSLERQALRWRAKFATQVIEL